MKYVSFLDILGFKDLIKNNPLEDVCEIYKNAFEKSYKIIFKDFSESLSADSKKTKINSRIISDSIVLWTEEATMSDFLDLLLYTNAITYTLFLFGIPLRGAFDIGDIGELTIDTSTENNKSETSILLGQGLTKAYTLGNLQQWSGCIISDEATEHFSSFENNGKTLEILIKFGSVQKFKVPFKTGVIREYYVANWPGNFESQPTDTQIRDAFKKHNKNITNWDVENKIKNTIDFIKFSFANR